ncbi:MAG: PQQ-dependent sugar dehydrogenase [Gemmatimonadaceae bacterium]|nr:PQQ-dependent sugar dehydrogenase [Gemmatimonadaceae bacterium]
MPGAVRVLRPLGALCVLAVLACGEDAGPPTNLAPEAAVIGPLPALQWSGGDTIGVLVAGSDPEQGSLPASALSWWVELHHGTHTHPFHPVTPGSAGALGIPRLGHTEAEVFLRIYARAVDADGAADTAFVDIAPLLSELTLLSEPSGLQVSLDGQPRSTPYTETAIVGMRRSLRPVDPQEFGEGEFSFREWSDGGVFEREVVVPATALSVEARFDSIGAANAAPSVALLGPGAGATVTLGEAIAVSAQVSDADGDAFTLEALLDGDVVASVASQPGQSSYAMNVTPLGTGRLQLTLRAEDARGKSRSTEPVEVVVQAADGSDAVPPVATLTSPTADTRGLSGSINLAATATDDVGVVEVQFAIDDSVFAVDGSPPYTATLLTTASYASGRHTFRARARDAAGNWSEWSRAPVEFSGAVELEAGFWSSVWVSGFSGYPTAMAFAPDGRLFVTEQGGALRVIKDGLLLPTPFVTVPSNADGERGLLGVAFDPDFATTGWVYLYYTSEEDGAAAHNRIVRFTADGDVALPGSATVLLELPPLGEVAKHNGGAMHFGADGKLYIAVGDATMPLNAQDLGTPFGKILRLNRNGTIPADNPFLAQTTGVARAIWAIGLRNPFTFSISPATGRMHINDVGAAAWEEINVGRAGANFGWPQAEGVTETPLLDAPLLAYGHSASPTLFDGDAVIGGDFYPAGGSFGERFAGDYFFADFGRGWVYRLDAADGWRPAAFAQLKEYITGLAVGPDGALYVLAAPSIIRIAR